VADRDSFKNTILVAFALCIVCSVVVAASAVLLRPAQQANKELDRNTNILAAAGLLIPGKSIDEQFARVSARVVDLDAGRFTDAVDPRSYDQRKASKDPQMSVALDGEQDIAKIIRREKYSVVYLVDGEQGIDKLILPIRGYGLWSTLHGFIALEGDFNTVAGIGFYQHAETPGLGGEVDNPLWKAKWVGKKVYDDQGGETLSVIKGEVDVNRPQAVHQVDGLSGATLTSRGVNNLVHYWLGEQGFAPLIAHLRNGGI